MKSIIFTICSLLFLIAGIWLFGFINKYIPDSKWFIVVIKILTALLALIIYILIVCWFANVFNITWHYPSI